jgi:glycosyltransferase involved in cell wall biosynthesis
MTSTLVADIAISVVVCAYTMDRCDQLVAVVESVVPQLTVEFDEIIVVIDHNTELERAIAERLPARVRITSNTSTRGLSGARNSGVALARNDVVAFIDDDAVSRASSVAAVRQRFSDHAVQAVGGAVHPVWEGGRPPSWFPSAFGWVVGCDYDGLPDDGGDIRNPIGAAMAVRKSSLERVGGFSAELGRVGTLPAGCEETLMGIGLRSEFPEAKIIRETGFAVDHFVPRSRQTRRYFLNRCLHEGRSKAILSSLVGNGPSLSTEKNYVVRTLTASLLTGLRRGLRGDVSAFDRVAMLVAGLFATVWGWLSPRRRFTGMMSKSAAKSADSAPGVMGAVSRGDLVTVVVPTIGRDSLAETVRGILEQDYENLQVVVVDNSPSTGRVGRVLGGVADPRFGIITQPIKGVSAARNAGIAAARGTLIAFTDDDAHPTPDWVSNIVDTFVRDTTNTVHAVTGRVVGIEMETAQQVWFETAGVFDKGEAPLVWSVGSSALVGTLGEAPDSSIFFPYTCGEVGSGNNFCLHRDSITIAGTFDEVLGAGTPTRGGEDLDMFRRILEAGGAIVYQPLAVVGHHHRADQAALRDQMYGYGIGMAAVLTKLAVTGAAIPVVKRIPQGARHLLHPRSARNVQRPQAMPRLLVWVELAGYMIGPMVYLRSRAARGAHQLRSHA